jgi:MFS family permease
MSLAPYRRLLALKSVRRLLLFGIVARVPGTAGAIALTLHVVEGLGRGYAAAGVMGASVTIGAAIGAPWRGRMVDRFGLRRALAPSIVVEGIAWGIAPWVSYEVLIGIAFVGGLMGLPIFTVIRQSLSILVPVAQRRTAYAVDSMGVEMSFMTGPAIGVVVATQVSTTAALLLVGATTVLAGIALSWFNPPTRSDQLVAAVPAQAGAPALESVEEAPSPSSRWLTSPALLAVLAAAMGATLVLAGTDVGVVAVLREAGAETLIGLVFVFWGIGSITGALIYGQLPRGVHPLWLLLALGALTIPVGLATTPWLLCALIVPAGALCAPVVSSTAEAVARLVPERSRGAAMGWHGSALTIGNAMGAPVAGAAIDGVAPWAGFAIVGAVGVVFATAALVTQRVRRVRRVSAGRRPAALSADGAGEPLARALAGRVGDDGGFPEGQLESPQPVA